MTTRQTLRVLNVEDSQSNSTRLQRHLSCAGYDVILERVDTAAAMQTAIDRTEWDVILSDYTMAEFSGLNALALLRETGCDVPFIVISGTAGEELAVEAMIAGASDYLMKDKLTRLAPAIEREMRKAANRRAMRVAEKQLSRTEVQRQRDRLNNIVAGVPGIVWESWGRTDAVTQPVDFVSDYIETMLGYRVDEWLSMPDFWLSIVHPEDRENAGKDAAANFAANRRGAQEFRWLTKDGAALWVESNYVTITGDDGRPAGMRGVTIDITPRRQAEARLRESEERYRELFEGIPDPTFVIDQETLFVVAVNEAAVREYGYSREEFISLTSRDIWPMAERDAFTKRLSESWPAADSGAVWKHLRKDGTPIDVETTLRSVLLAGRSVWVMLARNVTARRILEEQLRQSQKMEAVGQLAGGMAHDFNNLLTVITGYSELAMRRLQDQDPLLQDLGQIKRAGDRAAALTRQLLAFSRHQVLVPTVLSLNFLITDLEKMLRRLVREDIILHTDLAQDAGNVKADLGQMEQALMNLVVNACDAMPTGGTLTIETQNVDLTADYAQRHAGVQPGPHVMFAVSDTGTGMDAQTRARIFEPFFTTKEAGKGTGLGLSTVYGIIQQLNGVIWVYSEVGRGTTFKIYLPRIEGAVQRSPFEAPDAADRGTETILLAEDDEMVRTLARKVLSTYGYQVLEAMDGGTALELCERHSGPIHLLVTDVVMPGMGGAELRSHLEKVRPEIKVLYMSGYTNRAIVRHQVMDEKTPFIQKPFAPRALVNKVRETLDRP